MKSHVEQISAAILTLNQSPSRPKSEESERTNPDSKREERQRPSDSDQRLVIQEDPATGTFIYTILDRTTGEVLSQLPREELLRLRESPVYSAGSLIAAKA